MTYHLHNVIIKANYGLKGHYMKRYNELDSLRGIAAFTVMIAHLTMVDFYNKGTLWLSLNDTPLRFLWAGHQAVIFFFVLSGFVLSLPFVENRSITYGSFMMKRICRIYIPYITAIFSALFLRIFFSWNSVTGFEEFKFWSAPITSNLILNHLFLLGFFDYTAFDTAMWSLVHEMRISIIFPFAIIILRRYNFKICAIITVLLSALAGIIQSLAVPHFSYFYNYHETIHYLSLFIIGFLLARYRNLLMEKYNHLTQYSKLLLYLGAFLIYSYPFYNHWTLPQRFAGDWGTAIGSTIFIITAISSKNFSKILTLNSVAFLGKISYSLYLYHSIVLLSLINLMYGSAPAWIIWSATIFTSLLVASLAYYLIELPSISLGKISSAKFNFSPLNNINTNNP